MTIVCGDSHTATHGAFGALAFGIGTSEVEHVLATQTLLQRRPRTFEVRVEGRLAAGVTAKDVILALLARIGVGAGTGHVFEYTGPAIRALSMEQRMTICNMSIEGGARAGMVAPDDTTFEYVAGRPYAPRGEAWDRALADWRTLPGDDGAAFDRTVTLDAGRLEPMVTYGTNPGMGLPISGRVPDPEHAGDPAAARPWPRRSTYMDLRPGEPLLGRPVDVVFIGSCTNSRISDLRQAAQAAARPHGRPGGAGAGRARLPGRQAPGRGRGPGRGVPGRRGRVARGRLLDVPGHERRPAGPRPVRGVDLQPQLRGPPGRRGRTFLASPLTAAASALAGRIADARPLVDRGV
jgi:3-isopropylmalate/(R)-2-methylmalate dehydratase large subunit